MSYNLGDAIGYIKLNIKDFEDKYNEVHSKTEVLENTVDNLGHIFDKAGKLAAAAFAGISAAAVKAVKDVTSVGSSFEAAMSQVAATMGMTVNDIQSGADGYVKLTEAAREMGATTKYTATEAAEALNYLALAGYDVEDSISVLPKVLNTAAAGGMDLAKASDMVTDAMSALGLSVDDTELFVDRLAKTSQKSNTSIAQLGEGILQIGGTARSLAGGVTELDTALGILANNGIKAAEGGTALRQVILNLTAPTEKAKEYMESIGLSAYDAAGNMKPLNQIFRELDDIMSQFNTQQEKDNVITSIFDARQLKSARALLANYGEQWDKLYNQIENANGAASTMATTMSTNLNGSLTIAKSAIEAVQVTVFETFKESFTNATNEGIKSIENLNRVLKSPEMQENLAKIGKSIADVLLKFTEFLTSTAIPKFVEFASNLKEIAIALKSALLGLSVAIPITAAGLIACNETVQIFVTRMIAAKAATLATNAALLANPYTAVAVGLGVLVGATVNYVSQTNAMLDAARNQTTEFSKMRDAVNDNIQALEDSKNKTEEISGSNNEQINQIRTLTNMLMEYTDKTELSATELENAKDIISKLNELYPENTAYIENGQIKAYEGLTTAVQNYTEQLYYAAVLEGKQQENVQAYTSMQEAESHMAEYAEAVNQTAEAYRQAEKDLKYYQQGRNNYRDRDMKAAKAQGMTIKQYYQTVYEARKADWENAVEAYTKNKQVYDESKKLYEKGEQELLGLKIKAGVEVEGVYEDQQEAQIAAQQRYAEERKKQEMELHKDEIAANQKLAEEKQKNYDKMWEDLAELDRKYQMRQISSEDEYMEKQKKLLEDNWNEYDDNWVKRYNKILVYEEQANKKRIEEQEKLVEEQKQKSKEERQEFENNIKEKIEDLEYRNQIDEKYTKEMMYKDMEVIRDGLSEQDNLYKDINKKIVLGRKELGDELAKAEVDNANKAFSSWQKSLNNVVTEAEKSLNELESNKRKMESSLLSSVDLYETTTKRVFDKTKREFVEQEEKTLSNKALKSQLKDLEKYEKTIDKLKEKNIGDNLMSKILGMDPEEGAKFAETLNKMSTKELKNYSDTYDEVITKTQEMSSKYYDSQIKTMEEDFTKKYEALLHNVPKNVELVGQETIQGFIDGLQSKADESEGAVNAFFTDVIDKTKSTLGVHSPSTVYYEIGENVVDGMVNGITDSKTKIVNIFSDLGTQTGKTFIEKFNAELQNIFSSFSAITSPVFSAASGVANSLNTQIPISNNPNSNMNSIENSSVNYSFNGLTKSDVVAAIKEAQPDGDVIFKVNSAEFGRIARSSLNLLAKSSGNMGLKV